MRNFINSKKMTVFLFLIGLLMFAVIFPSLISARGDNFATSLAAIYGGYLSFFLCIFHFFWLRDQRIGFRKVIFPFLKSFSLCFVLISIFMTYQYYFGSMYGGKMYQRRAKLATVKLTLADYYYQQMEQMKYTKRYDLNLHKTERFSSRFYIIGTSEENTFIKEHCSDCEIKSNHFKVAIYQKDDEGVIFATISDKSKQNGHLEIDFVIGNSK